MQIAAHKFYIVAFALSLTWALPGGASAADRLDHGQMPKSAIQYTETTGHDLYHRGFYPEAIEVWRRAYVENNDAGALYVLGTTYIDGIVVGQDIPRGLDLLGKSALRGEARAQFELGSIYDDGKLVKRNSELAVLWYTLASTHNDPGSEFNLAVHYEEGDGVETDWVLAFAFYHLAILHGLPDELLPVTKKFESGLTAAQRKAGVSKANRILETRTRSAALTAQ
jgi:TPR repeat protein